MSGIDGIPSDLLREVAESLRAIVGNEYDGRELRRDNCAILLKELMDDPSDIEIILQGMQWVPYSLRYGMAETIALYGSNGVEILLEKMEIFHEQDKYHIVLALGWIGDQRAVESLRKLIIAEQTSNYTRILALAILVTCFEDIYSKSEFLPFLLFQRDNESGKDAWWQLNKLGEEAVLWGVKEIMRKIDIRSMQWLNASDMCLKISIGFRNNQLLGKFLLKKYEYANNVDEIVFIFDIFGAIAFEEAENILLEGRSNPNCKIKAAAINAYSKLSGFKVATLIDALNDNKDIRNVRNAISALGKLDSRDKNISIAVNGLARRLLATKLNEENERWMFDLYPTAMLIIDALISINTPEALHKATEWCKAQLDSEHSARYAGYKSLSDVAYFYLQYKIETEEAEEIAKEWGKQKLEQVR
ncbi:MAG: hypothetical protein JEZ00_11190 [Anaerolineaceae bacterium]|nr:hypothetical protein [Anaerolineaceae bacterium]